MFKLLFNVLKGLVQTVLIPYAATELLKTKHRKTNAEYIGFLAEEVVGALARKYPGKENITWINEAVLQLKSAAGLSTDEVAVRAIQAAMQRILK